MRHKAKGGCAESQSALTGQPSNASTGQGWEKSSISALVLLKDRLATYDFFPSSLYSKKHSFSEFSRTKGGHRLGCSTYQSHHMNRPKSPVGSSPASKYEKGDQVWVIYDGRVSLYDTRIVIDEALEQWEKGTVEGSAGSSDNAKCYSVKRDLSPVFANTFAMEDMRKRT